MKTKRCGGDKGHWECEDDYPDHIVPVKNFRRQSTAGDGLKTSCRKCMGHNDLIRELTRPRHPITGEKKHCWKSRIAKSLGGIQGTSGWQSKLDEAEKQWEKEILQDVIYNIAPPFNLVRTKRKLPKVNRPKSKRVTTIQVDDPRGFVYIFKDHMKREGLYKIGASHAPQERLDQANTWGDFESIYESEEVADCAKLEKEAHQSLRKYQVKGEWFNIPKDIAINTIKEIVNESFNYAVAS